MQYEVNGNGSQQAPLLSVTEQNTPNSCPPGAEQQREKAMQPWEFIFSGSQEDTSGYVSEFQGQTHRRVKTQLAEHFLTAAVWDALSVLEPEWRLFQGPTIGGHIDKPSGQRSEKIVESEVKNEQLVGFQPSVNKSVSSQSLTHSLTLLAWLVLIYIYIYTVFRPFLMLKICFY